MCCSFFFFKQKTAYEVRISDWSSDVCSSDLTEHGVKFRADPAGAHKTGFFADQRDNRQWLSQQVEGKRVLDLCCNTGGFGVYAAVRGAGEVVGVDIDQDVLDIARGNAKLNDVRVRFVQARSEEHTSELQSLMRISYAVFCLK